MLIENLLNRIDETVYLYTRRRNKVNRLDDTMISITIIFSCVLSSFKSHISFINCDGSLFNIKFSLTKVKNEKLFKVVNRSEFPFLDNSMWIQIKENGLRQSLMETRFMALM